MEKGSQATAFLAFILDVVSGNGDSGWPVYQYLDVNGPKEGFERPQQCLEELPSDLIRFDQPLDASSRVMLLFLGAIVGGLSDAAQHAFVEVLRSLADRWGREPMLVPDRAQPVVVHAHELWGPELGSASDLRVIGLLLESEEIGYIEWGRPDSQWEEDGSDEWTNDPNSPFSIEIRHWIREFEDLRTVADCLRLLQAKRGGQAPAA